jgi:hypothetical protein
MEHPPEPKAKEESVYEMPVGKLKERLKEAIKMMPGVIADMAKVYVIALKSLGKSEEETGIAVAELHRIMMGRIGLARGKADQRFEKKTAA